MKIILTRPNYHSHLVTPPLALGYLSAYLRNNGYQVKIVDGLNYGLTNQEIVEQCQEADLVGISIMSDYFLETKDLCQKLKQINKKVVLGGPHPSVLAKETLEETKADYVIIGEGEETLLDLVKAIENQQDVKQIPGLISRNKKEFIPRPLIKDLDSLPFLDWSALDPRNYKKAPHGALIKNFPVAPIISSRGCPYQCKFCASPAIWHRIIRFRSPANVVDEIEYLVNNFGVKEIHFEDDNLTLKKEHVSQICSLILERNLKISWATPNGIRADQVNFEILQLMKQSGCYYIVFGIESGNQEILDSIEKKEKLIEIERAVNWSHRLGLMTQGFFIFGLPGETEKTIKRTIDFAKKIPLDRAQFLLLDLLPGSALWREYKDEIEIDYSKRSYQEATWIPPGLTKETLEKSQSLAFRSFFFRPRPLFSLIKYFRFCQLRFVLNRLKDFRIFNFKI